MKDYQYITIVLMLLGIVFALNSISKSMGDIEVQVELKVNQQQTKQKPPYNLYTSLNQFRF